MKVVGSGEIGGEREEVRLCGWRRERRSYKEGMIIIISILIAMDGDNPCCVTCLGLMVSMLVQHQFLVALVVVRVENDLDEGALTW